LKPRLARTLAAVVFAACCVFPLLVSRMVAPANYGGHALTSGFGRGRLDLQGIVSEGSGGKVDLPAEPLVLTLRLSGDGPISLKGQGVERTISASSVPIEVSLDLPHGGPVAIESAARIRLYEIAIERVTIPWTALAFASLFGLLAVMAAARRDGSLFQSFVLVVPAVLALAASPTSRAFAGIAGAKALPTLVVLVLFLPLVLAIRASGVPPLLFSSSLVRFSFACSLVLAGVQLVAFEQPLPLGDPGAYFEMAGRFADAMGRVRSPFDLGPVLSDVQAYLALPATGLLYGLLRFIGGGLSLIYATQAVAMALAVATLVSISESEFGSRAGRIAFGISLLHPSFSILPGIVQPEPFMLAAWTLAALLTLHAVRAAGEPRVLLAAGVLTGVGLALHPQGLSFLLLALFLCLLPWSTMFMRRPILLIAPLLGTLSALLPVAAAEHFSKPLAYTLDKQYGFFAYTSPHPLGFWLYIDSDGWQGPLRIEDTTYQKELIALKGETAVGSTFADVAAFIGRHPKESAIAVLRNLHRLWHQPDNPFAVPFVMPYSIQVAFHRALVVLFVVSLPALLAGRWAVLSLPFVMLSMTYPAYHVFNKYATPALPFIIIGASFLLDRLFQERRSSPFIVLIAGLAGAALGALLPATWAARAAVSGDIFLFAVRALLWVGLGTALAGAVFAFRSDVRSKLLASVIGGAVLIASSWAAAQTDTSRGVWSSPLDTPFDASCRLPGVATTKASSPPPDPAWILIDIESQDSTPPVLSVNDQMIEKLVPTMPPFGLATFRGRRAPETFRQIWRAPIPESMLSTGELRIRLTGGSQSRVFGDVRDGDEGPRLSVGNWPYLSVYRLMHEGQYRLPTRVVPSQACKARGISGRPGISLVRVAEGEEDRMSIKAGKPLEWIF
jgi:4-amino-4-deoxy-L-arabinose transferase-like glycosyltransferase